MLMDKSIATAVEYVDLDLSELSSTTSLNADKINDMKFRAQGESVRLLNAYDGIVLAELMWAIKDVVDEIVLSHNGKDYLILEQSDTNALRSSKLVMDYCLRPYELKPIKQADTRGFEINIKIFAESSGDFLKALKELDEYRYGFDLVRLIIGKDLILETASTLVRVFYMSNNIELIPSGE